MRVFIQISSGCFIFVEIRFNDRYIYIMINNNTIKFKVSNNLITIYILT